MTKEERQLTYFKKHQLLKADFSTGKIKVKNKAGRITEDFGSVNSDGYVRVWCGDRSKGERTHRMKHRVIYYLANGCLPPKGSEIDHIDSNRSNNALDNLRVITKSKNNTGCVNRSFPHMKEEDVHFVCKLLQETTLSDLDIANEVGRSRCTVRDIKSRRTRINVSQNYVWDHRGY